MDEDTKHDTATKSHDMKAVESLEAGGMLGPSESVAHGSVAQQQVPQLHRRLNNRQIQLIAIGKNAN